MTLETTSKNMDGITDLVVVAPIKEGFIAAYENVTYATRLRIVAEALNRVRVTAREYEEIAPFSDVTQRILTLLDFRVGVIDKDVFALPPKKNAAGKWPVQARRYLYLTATFDGAWEPYMRLIWDPLGPFLDLLFCNCEGYVTASEHDFDEYAQWVRDNQMDSAIFYAASGVTVRDQLYLSRLEQRQRSGPAAKSDQDIARLVMPDPEKAATAERVKAVTDMNQPPPKQQPDTRYNQYKKIHEMALEALTVLYRLADFYPPQWLINQPGLAEGHYLARVAKDLLKGWDDLIPTDGPLKIDWDTKVVPAYREPLRWFETGKAALDKLDQERRRNRRKDPELDPAEIQGGVLKPQCDGDERARYGALMLMTITDAAQARALIKGHLGIHYTDGDGAVPPDGYFRTIGLTASGLRRLGMLTCVMDHFPKEFREGMEVRAGLIGDMRENHPRRWTLPRRGGPRLSDEPADTAKPPPPVELSEVDFVIQIRSANGDRDALIKEVRRLAKLAECGASLQACQMMESHPEPGGFSRENFGFLDGFSQPRPVPTPEGDTEPEFDEVRLGELLLGYRNDRGDFAPVRFGPHFPDWRRKDREAARAYQRNGTFLVIRKLEQHVETFKTFLDTATKQINEDHPGLSTPMTPERLMAKLIGREPEGKPLIVPKDGSLNNFTYQGDETGEKCPFAAHIRRANPRNTFQGRRAPRLMRRGMSYDDSADRGGKGLVFMAYNASIAEQYETIQRWINGGNSTDIASGHNDPLTGVAPRTGAMDKAERVFRFVEENEVIRVTMPDPFVSLHWGLYLFVPSRTALHKLCELEGGYQPMEDSYETIGKAIIDRMAKIDDLETRGHEWKRLLEDFDAKDPAEKNISPDVWSAIRWYLGGSIRIPGGMPLTNPDWNQPPPEDQQMILCASYPHVMEVLSDWKTYSTEEQLRRITDTSGPIFVTQQPDDTYKADALNGKCHYRDESEDTNAILMAYGREKAFLTGYEAGKAVLEKIQAAAAASKRDYYKLELRRQYVLPALGGLCRAWYGLPDGKHMKFDAWRWEDPADRGGPCCPGDFLSPSRHAFYPRPSDTVARFAKAHGEAILAGCLAFVTEQRAQDNGNHTGPVASAMFAAIPDDDPLLARNLIGTMVGAIPPMDGNLRGILLEWLNEKTLWRHQAALHAAMDGERASSDATKACELLLGPVSQAMCKRPAPDLLYRTATKAATLRARGDDRSNDIAVKERDLVVVSLVSAAQRSLHDKPNGDVSIVFGGNRRGAYQGATDDPEHPVHACPAQDMAMGAIMGILAALLDAGRIQVMPASLIVRINDWR